MKCAELSLIDPEPQPRHNLVVVVGIVIPLFDLKMVEWGMASMVNPNSATILSALGGKKRLWQDVVEYLEAHYDHEPVVTREGKERSLTIRYRRGGKTLVTLYPKESDFVVLVVLGKDEVEKAKVTRLNENVKGIFENAHQYHDGRWLWIKPRTKSDIDSIFAMLAVKRKPKDQRV